MSHLIEQIAGLLVAVACAVVIYIAVTPII